MKSKNTRPINTVLNPFLGFGWSTGFVISKNNEPKENKSSEKVLKVKIEQ